MQKLHNILTQYNKKITIVNAFFLSLYADF